MRQLFVFRWATRQAEGTRSLSLSPSRPVNCSERLFYEQLRRPSTSALGRQGAGPKFHHAAVPMVVSAKNVETMRPYTSRESKDPYKCAPPGPLSAVRRKTSARVELFSFCPNADLASLPSLRYGHYCRHHLIISESRRLIMRLVVLLVALLIAGCTGDRLKSDSADKTANALLGLARGPDHDHHSGYGS
jgi:hypothetical protein